MGRINTIAAFIATLGPVGYLPAPGTWGTLCAVPAAYALLKSVDHYVYCIFFVLFTIFATLCVEYALPHFDGKHDPSHIVIDECVGFFAIWVWIEPELHYFIIGFLLFRAFDIIKPFGIQSLEQHDGAAAIIVDDVAAAFYVMLIMQVCINFGL